ncbi:hypothetical protein EDD15DRAFT_2203760 [Pisolithus albus]|nr:hypothetical protein EDD15DRAFT_2203760 [Pisolithus albus]
MLHLQLNPKHPDGWNKPESLEAWSTSNEKTIKLDVLAKIIKHHLEKDGQCLLTTATNAQELIPQAEGTQDITDYVEPNWIIVYSTFPSSNGAIFNILQLYDIQAVELNGSLTVKKWQTALNTFCKPTCTTRLQDTKWSALDNEQLKGWIFHYPQQKQVHIY